MMNLNPMQIMSQINQLKKMYRNPKEVVEQMLSEGKITQEQLNEAIEMAKNVRFS